LEKKVKGCFELLGLEAFGPKFPKRVRGHKEIGFQVEASNYLSQLDVHFLFDNLARLRYLGDAQALHSSLLYNAPSNLLVLLGTTFVSRGLHPCEVPSILFLVQRLQEQLYEIDLVEDGFVPLGLLRLRRLWLLRH